MTNKILKFGSCAVALACCFSFAAAGCGGGTSSDSYTVTFNYNYDGAPESTTQEVAKGDVAVEPDDPTRENYSFIAWYTAAEGGSKFDFEEVIYEDTTVYAQWTQTAATITFDYNYSGAPAAGTSTVSIGGTVSEPSSPTRDDGYLFTGWYTDSSCTTAYDFSTTVSGDMTLYAGWEESSGDTFTVTFMWNYDGAPDSGVANTVTYSKNSKVKNYSLSRTDGDYLLGGWYTDEACTVEYAFSSRENSNLTLYAKWLAGNTFEAEYVDFTGMIGNGYSGNQSGVGLIVKQKADSQQASNGYYVGWMYREGNTLTFNIECDKAVTDAVIKLRLSAEFYDMTFTNETFLVQVNGENLAYDSISITDVPEQGTNNWKTFQNFTMTSSGANIKVSLNEGSNTIKLIINNSDRLGESGTMYATAPLIDCLYIYTDATLTWEPLTENLNGNVS